MLITTIQALPDSPGIYQFFDEKDKLLYVGKAKNLKNRVKSYFKFTPNISPAPNLSLRIHKMIAQAVQLNYIVVSTEADALILENSLIKQLKPKYNILLRDDKTYPYIYINDSARYPRLDITRKIVTKNGAKIRYFGPITSGARELLNAIYSNFKLVQKENCLKGSKACLFYQLNMCLAPCQFEIDANEYSQIVQQAIDCISDPSKLIPRIKERMLSLAEELRFEEASVLKDQIKSIETISPTSNVDLAGGENFDIVAISEGETEACVVWFFIRNGKLISSTHSFIQYADNDHRLFDQNEALNQVIYDFYSEDIPNSKHELLVPIDLPDKTWLEASIKNKTNRVLKIIKATKEKERLVNIAIRNGYELLKNRQKDIHNINYELKSYFNLENTPLRIEVFDNSHMAKQASVAGMIVWDDGFDKKSYRKYHLEGENEYAQMKEVLTRRAKNFNNEPPPDLWLLDGGKASFELAKDILQSCGANVDILAIAKEKRDAKAVRSKTKAEDKIISQNGSVKLPVHDPKLLFLQKLRDEAHRFAIDFHRKEKLKEDKSVKILQLRGIKEGKLKKLLSYFGTFENISKASVEQLELVLSQNDAKLIVDFFTNTKQAYSDNISNNKTKEA